MSNTKKKEQYFKDAERLYVEDLNTLSEITGKYKLSLKTLQNWKKDGCWEEKRKKYQDKRQSLHEELYDFARALLKSVKEDMENKVRVDPGRLYALNNILYSLKITKNYEDLKKPEEKKDADETIKAVKELLGLKHEA